MALSRVYFTTDVHGSTRCFKKFLNTVMPQAYKADVLILGGDITGKVMLPIIERADGGYDCTFQGDEVQLKNRKEVDELIARAADSGSYCKVMSKKEFEEVSSDPARVTGLFNQLMVERVQEWVDLAEQRLGKTKAKCFISPGNDDIFQIDPVLNSSSYVVNPEEKVVDIDQHHEMITLGTTNHTPWHSPREVDEEVLREKIEKMAEGVKDMKSAIFNIHVPPINTLIDQAPQVDESLKVVVRTGHIQMISAGSTACRAAIEKHQPLLGVHGHIHESRGVTRIGKTTCANPGSEYGEGILRGFLADLDGAKLKSYLLTSG